MKIRFKAVKAGWIIAVGVVGLLGVGYSISLGTAREPVYEGKRYTEWLHSRSKDRLVAMRSIGTNAVPVLMREMAVKDSYLKEKFIEKAPQKVKDFFNLRPAKHRRSRAFCAFVGISKNAECALPSLTGMLKDPELAPRAVSALCNMGETARPVLPELVECLGHANVLVRRRVSTSIRRLDPEGLIAVPRLLGALDDPDHKVRVAVTNALRRYKVDPVVKR